MERNTFELHIHSIYSLCKIKNKLTWYDGVSTPRNIIKRAHRIGLSGLAITDHNSISAINIAKREGKKYGLVVIPGSEVRSIEGVDVLVLGVDHQIKSHRPLVEIIDKIKDLNGIAVKAHPIESLKKFILPFDSSRLFDALEINAATNKLLNQMLEKYAKKKGIRLIGGSDSHNLYTLGYAVTIFQNQVSSADEAIKYIKKNLIHAKQYGTGNVLRLYVFPQRFRLLFTSLLHS